MLAFVPGAGFPAERMLEPELAAVLVRAALEAAGAGEPYEVKRAAELEMQSGEPLALDWRADAAPLGAAGAGVLEENVSVTAAAVAKDTPAGEVGLPALKLLARQRGYDLRSWFIVLAMVLAALELWLEQRRGSRQR